MKRNLLILVFCTICCNVLAETPETHGTSNRRGTYIFNAKQKRACDKSNHLYKMTGFAASDGYEFVDYSYDNGRLVSIHDEINSEALYYTDSIRYNNQGQIVRIDGYQELNFVWKHVYYIEYTYNAQGLLASRSNYNNFGEWELGGVYNYTYDSDGNITLAELTMNSATVQRIEYEYSDGRLLREIWKNADFESGLLTPAEKIEYSYGSNGLVQEAASYVYENTWIYNGKKEYTYDDAGNCTEYVSKNPQNQIVERSVYEYEQRSVDDTYIPVIPEDQRPYIYDNTNIYYTEHWYTIDIDNVLQYVCDYNYFYNGIDGIGTPEDGTSSVKIHPNPASNAIFIDFEPEGPATISIFDQLGRQVKRADFQQSIDVSDLPAGAYFLQIRTPDNVSAKTFCIAR